MDFGLIIDTVLPGGKTVCRLHYCLAAVALAGFGIELGVRELRAGVDDAVAFIFSLVLVVVARRVFVVLRLRVLIVLCVLFVLRSSCSWCPLVVQYSLLLVRVRVWFKGQNGIQEHAFLLSCVLCSGF